MWAMQIEHARQMSHVFELVRQQMIGSMPGTLGGRAPGTPAPLTPGALAAAPAKEALT